MDSAFDSFLNYDQDDYTPVSTTADLKSTPSSLASLSNSTFATSSSRPPTFSGPSYPYDSHRQQTGLPIGALANTFAVNQASGLHYRPGNNGFVLPTDTLNVPLVNYDEFDAPLPLSLDNSEMDYDHDSPNAFHTMAYQGGSQNVSSLHPTQQRVYPGMHSEQAAQAKAKQAELRRQEEAKPIPGQKPLPVHPAKASPVKDPHVEESISRLLSRMRHNSDASVADGDDLYSSPNGLAAAARIKKDEDDMDEDERLLASEAGKKLSSKERRQLRNKVSARAFRSRRKEYIGQLEGEVAAKVQEADELRTQNRQLMEENKRLTELTRMLLSSQSFSGFLQELSSSGAPAHDVDNVLPISQHPPQPQSQSQNIRKDISAHEAARQVQQNGQHMHVGMTFIPETNMEESMLQGNSWNTMLPSNDFQVFAVTALPEPPSIDFTLLADKSDAPARASKDLPALAAGPRPPMASVTSASYEVDESVELDVTEFDLYFDPSAATPASIELELPTAVSITLSKAAVASELAAAVRRRHEEPGSWDALHTLCESLDERCHQLGRFVPTD